MNTEDPANPGLVERLSRLPGAVLLTTSYLLSRSSLVRRASRMLEPPA